MRTLMILLAMVVGLSACNPGRPGGGTSNGQMTATFGNIVGTPVSGISLSPFTSTTVFAATSSLQTQVAGDDGTRVVQLIIAPAPSASGSCTEKTNAGLGCIVSIGKKGTVNGLEISKTASLNYTLNGNTITVTGTAHFENLDKTVSHDIDINTTSTVIGP
jgi:hypothetical protein